MMNLQLVNLSDNDQKQLAEVNRDMCLTSGYDPVVFANTTTGLSGKLGMPLLKEYYHAPVASGEDVGTLDETKYYAIALKPYSTFVSNPNTGTWMFGTSTQRSDPVSPSAALKSIAFDLPDLCQDGWVFFAGYGTGGDATTFQDNTRTFTSNTLIGYRLLNIDTGLWGTITANDDISFTLDTDLETSVGDRYHIYQCKITGYEVYAAEANSAAEIDGVTFVLQGVVDADVDTWYLSSYGSGGVPLVDNNFPPDNYRACVAADNRLFCGGGVYDATGEAEMDISPLSFSASVANPVAISVVADYAIIPEAGAGTARVIRFTLPTGQTVGRIRRGSLITISAAEDSDNDVVDALVTHCDEVDGNWFDLAIDDGLANADDEAIVISGKRNVLVGNISGVNQTAFSEGMVNARFKFANDLDSYKIIWVDELNQEMGIFMEYLGLNGGMGTYDPRPVVAPKLNVSGNANIGECLHATDSGITWANMTDGETYAMWINIDSFASNTIIDFIEVGSEFNVDWFKFSYSRTGDYWTMVRYDGTNFSNGWNSADPTLDEWFHLALVCETGAAAKLYINGVELTLTQVNGSCSAFTPPDTRIRFGDSFMSYNLSKIKIYNSALSGEEVLADMNGGTIAGVEASWKCNEGSGLACADSSGSANDLAGYVLSYGSIGAALTSMEWGTFTYEGGAEIENDNDVIIASDLGIAWSDSGTAHIFRTENYTPVSDTVTALASFNQSLIIFCENSLWKVPLQGLGVSVPYLISDKVSCTAPHSVIATTTGVFFYDGHGISMTDGQQVVPVTAYRAGDYLGYINNSRAYNIRGVYDPDKRRIEYYFAYGDSEINNMGITISIDSMNCYPSQRIDVNAAWIDRNDEGDLMIYHGSTNEIGKGTVWRHEPESSTDGNHAQELVGNISDITDNTITVDFGEAIDDVTLIKAGDVFMYLPISGGVYFQFRIVSITLPDAGEPSIYEIVVEPDNDMSDFEVGGTAIAGGIPFDYGIKWSDFTGPQYMHKIRQLHVDVTNFNGIIFVEHYANMIDSTPVYVSSHSVNDGSTKIVSSNKAGDCYQYGFRIYGLSMTKFEFHSFEILFDVEA